MPKEPVRTKKLFRPTVAVRCLGPGSKEHTFLSTDPTKYRICARCADKMRGLSERIVKEPVVFDHR